VREPLPIDDVLPAVLQALATSTSLLLMAPPGSGKTTRVPPALLPLLGERGGEVVVLEPRRLAARAAASRVAQELGTEVGALVGYQVRGDARTSRQTRVRFVTEGVLVRQLVQDPCLEGVGAVCLDEFHERHLEGDLALAMLAETRATVRPDLRLCVMSATLDPAPLRAFLPGCATVTADGRLFAVKVVHQGAGSDLEVDVRTAVERALDETNGDVLVFLPGTGEINRCEQALDNLARLRSVLVLPLHGRLDPADQDRAIRPQNRRKVVLSTNVAESSLTIAGVTAVVDSGLARELRFDRGRGVDVLQLEKISIASATQRTGRAGRTGPGICYRLWSAAQERAMPQRTLPEVQRVDLCGPALLVRAFAGRDPSRFQWFEPPPGQAPGRGGRRARRPRRDRRRPRHPAAARQGPAAVAAAPSSRRGRAARPGARLRRGCGDGRDAVGRGRATRQRRRRSACRGGLVPARGDARLSRGAVPRVRQLAGTRACVGGIAQPAARRRRPLARRRGSRHHGPGVVPARGFPRSRRAAFRRWRRPLGNDGRRSRARALTRSRRARPLARAAPDRDGPSAAFARDLDRCARSR
jgi:ATP-dependent helicase HrpB